MGTFVEHYKYKIVLLGDGAVGKTSLVRKYVKNIFDEDYQSTLGTNIYLKSVMIEQVENPFKVTFSVWDLLGQRSYKHIIRGSLTGAGGIFLVCDLTSRESLLNLEQWISIVYEHLDWTSFIFLGNKSDLKNKEFGLTELNRIASNYNSPAFLTSAKTGENVEIGFTTLATRIRNNMHSPSKDQVQFPVFASEIDPKIQVTDKMIYLFCQEHGGYETIMPVVRMIFRTLDIDFMAPSPEDIHKLRDQLVEITRDEMGDTVAKRLKQKLDREIDTL